MRKSLKAAWKAAIDERQQQQQTQPQQPQYQASVNQPQWQQPFPGPSQYQPSQIPPQPYASGYTPQQYQQAYNPNQGQVGGPFYPPPPPTSPPVRQENQLPQRTVPSPSSGGSLSPTNQPLYAHSATVSPQVATSQRPTPPALPARQSYQSQDSRSSLTSLSPTTSPASGRSPSPYVPSQTYQNAPQAYPSVVSGFTSPQAISPLSAQLMSPNASVNQQRSPSPLPPSQSFTATKSLAPQSVPEASDPPSIRKILSLDGGGVRGLSEVMMLRYLMQQLGRKRGFPPGKNIDPWQEFDMIVGTSTGGLLAIMLGRLKLSLNQCEDAYLKMSERIFTPSRHGANLPARAYDFLQANGRFKSEPLEESIREILVENGMSDEELLWEQNEDGKACKVVVCAVQENGTPRRIRSYMNETEYDSLLEECQIWQAARATSAASTFFEPIKIGRYGQKFVDGALVDNNPIEVADDESKTMFPGQNRMIISFGTGIQPPSEVTGNALKVVKTLVKLVTDTEHRNEMFRRQNPDMVGQGRLYRFNVFQGLGALGLEEHTNKPKIAEFTERYLQDPDVMRSIQACANVMKEGGQRQHFIGGEDLSAYLEKLEVSVVDSAICYYCARGISFNATYFFCNECVKCICSLCRGRHQEPHRQSMLRCENIKWQKNMKNFAVDTRCHRCLEWCRARRNCRDCQFALCGDCFSEDSSRNAELQSHNRSYPEHRELVEIIAPDAYRVQPSTKFCSCLYEQTPLGHCDRCSKVFKMNEEYYWCRTCRLEYGSGMLLCGNCFASDDETHKSTHDFQIMCFLYEGRELGDIHQQIRNCVRCLWCGQISGGTARAIAVHPHVRIGLWMTPLLLELFRKSNIKNCPLRPSLLEGRTQPKNTVSGPHCAFCRSGVAWSEVLGLCLASGCIQVFCGVCTQQGYHGHRHPLQSMSYKKNTGNINLNHRGTCDGCGSEWMAGLFTGIECQSCHNKHYCNKCITRLTAGELLISNNGLHGCAQQMWMFFRFA